MDPILGDYWGLAPIIISPPFHVFKIPSIYAKVAKLKPMIFIKEGKLVSGSKWPNHLVLIDEIIFMEDKKSALHLGPLSLG